MDTYLPLPQPEEISTREREDAMGAYLMMFASIGAGLPLPIINLIASVIYYYVNKGKSRFVRFHSLQSLISQLPTTLMNAGGVAWGVQIFFSRELEVNDLFIAYWVTAGLFNLLYFIFSIVAAIKARKGQMYYFLFFGKLAYHQVYLVRGETEAGPSIQNLPPRL